MADSDNPLPIQPDNNSWLSAPTDASGRPVITVTPRSNVQNNMIDPTIGADYGTYDDPLIQSVKDAADKLFGLEGQTRYQTWPERLVRSAIMAPGDALAGKTPYYDFNLASQLPQEPVEPNIIGKTLGLTPSPINPAEQEIGRAMDMASLAGVGPMAEPATAEMTLGSGMTRMPLNGGEMADAPVFYSAVENAVNGAKIDNAPVSQWLGYLKNQPGVKQEELDYTLGELQPDQKMSKQDMQDYVDANKVQLNEVSKGQGNLTVTPNEEEPHILEVYRADDPTGEHSGMVGEIIKDQNNYTINVPELPKRNFTTQQDAEAFIKANTDFGAQTKFQQYQLPGGSNYKEMLMQLPTDSESLNVKPSIEEPGRFDVVDRTGRVRYTGDEIDAQNYKSDEIDRGLDSQTDFQSSHWDEPNVLAHVRMNDRNVDGLKTLNLEEIQSDWHQQGRQQGYRLTPAQKTAFDAIDQKIVDSGDDDVMGDPDIKSAIGKAIDKKILTPEEGRTYLQNYRGADAQNPVPNAPFKQTWPDLALKRMIRYAADNGYDAISWTPGEAQAARYDLSKQISKVQYNAEMKVLTADDLNGKEVLHENGIESEKLPDFIGKEASKKLLEQPQEGRYNNTHKLEGVDLKIGGEGMKAFYDKMLVDKANAIAKKYGGKVEDRSISYGGNPYGNKYGIEKGNDGRYYITTPDGRTGESFSTRQAADHQMTTLMQDATTRPIHFLRLPQSLKDTAQQKGFPLFSSGVMLQPVIGNPFKDKQWLKPVDYNPFTDS